MKTPTKLSESIQPLTGRERDYDSLLEFVGSARFVLIGEASHGTHEFYGERAQITKRLIQEKGFRAVAVEADWPDAYRINRWARGVGSDGTAMKAPRNFRRFPGWRGRIRALLEFIVWLGGNKKKRKRKVAVASYGLDLY